MNARAMMLTATVFAYLGCMSSGMAQETGSKQPAPQPKGEQESNVKTAAASDAAPESARSPLDFVVRDIDGRPVPLRRYRGKVVLIVNTASKCGLTPQYKALQALHEKYAERGLAILGFPANDFANQEPGTNEQIKKFCTSRFGVQFDMFSKVAVKGDRQCALYRFLTSPRTNPKFAGPIRWNFTKFLLNRQGRVIARFEPRTPPDDPKVIAAIEKALAQPAQPD